LPAPGIRLLHLLLGCLVLCFSTNATAEDGYSLWLRYAPLSPEAAEAASSHLGPAELLAAPSPTVEAAQAELARGLTAMLGSSGEGRGVVLARADRLTGQDARLSEALREKPPGAYRLTLREDGRAIVIAADDVGLLYGSFAILRHLATGGSLAKLDIVSAPALPMRMLNHWDNPDGFVERGYAGRSIFDWWRLPDHLDPKLIDYARANASVGINGVVVNNVNASALMLSPRYIAKLVRIADAFRPYGIRVFLSARFSAPRDLAGLEQADPLDPRVRAWWTAKADEIYAAVPDFGGFLVKANSEGQPGPQDYGRTHADGANMLAAALGDRGTVIWRAFVYESSADTDRVKLAYEEFKPLDGQFAPNVILQVKNGPLDFQPREPFHPLFGAMPRTRLMMEAQITKEYLGFATHLAFLAPMWAEVLDADTGHGGAQALTVAQVLGGGGMAGVANTGSDRNWTGGHFDQANWYAFGRLAWAPTMSSDAIAREWAAQTFSREPVFLDQAAEIMGKSHQAVVNYMTPLGLAHQMGTGHHYGPAPWVADLSRPEWNPVYYNRADATGIGFDRTVKGSNALEQYAPSVAARWANPETMDEDYLLWFHRLRWDHRTQSGVPLWAELIARYDRGVASVDWMAAQWGSLTRYVDSGRHRDVADFLRIQQREARWWRDASIAYFSSVCGCPLPPGPRAPEHSLEWYREQQFPDAPGNP